LSRKQKPFVRRRTQVVADPIIILVDEPEVGPHHSLAFHGGTAEIGASEAR